QDEQNQPNCGDINNLYENATADWQSPVTTLSQSVKKQEFDGLEEDLIQKYTVLVYGQDANSGTVLAWGCDDIKGEVNWGQSTTVQVDMLDRMPLYAGSYETTSYFDLVSALPPPIDTVVYFILDFFESPVGGLLSLSCELGNDAPLLGDLCNEVFSDPEDPSLDSLTTIGALIVQVLDAIIQSVASDSTFGDVLVGGKDLGDMLTGFQVQGTLTYKTEPIVQGACKLSDAPCAVDSDCGATDSCEDQQGVWADGQGVNAWNMLVVKWSLGEECNPYTDENCGKKNLSFNSFQPNGNPVEGSFGGRVVDFYNVDNQPHTQNVYYGALLNVIIQNALLPQLFGDGSDGSPVIVDTWEEMIFTLVGGKECLDPQWQNDNDLT
ncbi:MAG: hypothetical protein VX938_09745, partial [Myxococcota bacterium]|nr:hypothetical protein [Myxococcota bacterium]